MLAVVSKWTRHCTCRTSISKGSWDSVGYTGVDETPLIAFIQYTNCIIYMLQLLPFTCLKLT